jgi:hypothetical protein
MLRPATELLTTFTLLLNTEANWVPQPPPVQPEPDMVESPAIQTVTGVLPSLAPRTRATEASPIVTVPLVVVPPEVVPPAAVLPPVAAPPVAPPAAVLPAVAAPPVVLPAAVLPPCGGAARRHSAGSDLAAGCAVAGHAATRAPDRTGRLATGCRTTLSRRAGLGLPTGCRCPAVARRSSRTCRHCRGATGAHAAGSGGRTAQASPGSGCRRGARIIGAAAQQRERSKRNSASERSEKETTFMAERIPPSWPGRPPAQFPGP